MSEDQHPWTRREKESSVAYEAFRVYLFQGKDRTTRRCAEEIGKSDSLIRRWSSTYDWPARSVAYDSYMVNARVDGEADELARVRNKHLELADRLLDHLGDSLSMWKPGHDPSIRWTQAFAAAAKVQQTALTLREKTTRTDEEAIEKIMAVVEKLNGG